MFLSQKNQHDRDPYLVFDESIHKYTYSPNPEIPLMSVTSFLHNCFDEFNATEVIAKLIRIARPGTKYYGKTFEQIQNEWRLANQRGTLLHAKIEYFMNCETCPYPYTHAQLLEHSQGAGGVGKKDEDNEDGADADDDDDDDDDDAQGWQFFVDFANTFKDKIPYRTEWRVYDLEHRLSGSIDMVYLNPEDDTLSIFDWKRTTDLEKRVGFRSKMSKRFPSSLPDTKFHKYSLQLNIYKAIVERNYGRKVKELFLVGLHPDNESFQLMECADLSQQVEELFDERLKSI
jgi:hypothetical protein